MKKVALSCLLAISCVALAAFGQNTGCQLLINGIVVQTDATATSSQDCYKKHGFGSQNCPYYEQHFPKSFHAGANEFRLNWNGASLTTDHCQYTCPLPPSVCPPGHVKLGDLLSPGGNTSTSGWGIGTYAVCLEDNTVLHWRKACEPEPCGAYWAPRAGECDGYKGYSTVTSFGGKSYCVYNRTPTPQTSGSGPVYYHAREEVIDTAPCCPTGTSVQMIGGKAFCCPAAPDPTGKLCCTPQGGAPAQ